MPKVGGVRVDTGVYEGGEIPLYYDSMIAKLIVHGTDRRDAIAKMREALNGFVIRGVSSNIPFQAALLAHPKFQAGDFNTGFIAEHYAGGFKAEQVPHDDPDFLVALAAYANRRALQRSAGISACISAVRGVSTIASRRAPLWAMRIASGFLATLRSICAMKALPSTVPRMRAPPRCQLLQIA